MREPFYARMGRRILLRREECGITQEQLGKALRPPQSRAAISNMEKGRQRILAHTLVQIAQELCIPCDELTGVRRVPLDEQRRVELMAAERHKAALEAAAKAGASLSKILARFT